MSFSRTGHCDSTATGMVSALFFTQTGMGSRRSRRFLRYAALAPLVLLAPALLWASFGTSFQGVVTVLSTGSVTLSAPEAVAVDTLGNVYIGNLNNGQIVEVPVTGAASVLTFPGLSPALSNPRGMAVDASGNLYVSDHANARVVELSAGGVASTVNTGSLLSTGQPYGLALDAAGNLYISDSVNSDIIEVPAGGGAATILAISGLGTALFTPEGLAVDAAGNLYIADGNNNRIVKVTPGGVGSVLSITGPTLSHPNGVAFDGLGNLYISDFSNNRIVTVTPAGAGAVLGTGSYTLSSPGALAVTVWGAVYITDSGNNRIVEAQPTSVGFGHLQNGAVTGTTLTLPFSVSSSVTFGSVQAFTQGTAGLDFTVASTTCVSGVTSNAACTVTISFLPTAAGVRRGAVVLYTNASTPVPFISVPIYATADAPLAALSPGTATLVSTVGATLSAPFQVAFDGAGNMYVANYGSAAGNVVKVPAGGGSASVVSTAGFTLAGAIGVALDGAGNLYISDHYNTRIVEVTAGGVVSALNITGLSPVLNITGALAFDEAGNLYISDYGAGRVIKVTPSGAGSVLGTGSFTFAGDSVLGVAVDAAGTVYIPDSAGSRVVKVTAAGAASLVVAAGIAPPLSSPQGVAVDAFGNLYIADAGNRRIVEITTAGVASVLQMPGQSLLTDYGVTVDASGNVFIPDFSANHIVKVNVAGASLAAFPSTLVGQASSPETATVTNLGDQPLVFAASPAYTGDFSQPTGATDQCLISTSLLPGTVCDVSVQFTPQSVASLSASIVLTNDNLNVTGATQSVAVSGTGLVSPDSTQIAVTTNPTSVNIGQTLTVTAVVTDTATGHTATVPTGGVTFTDTVGSTSVSLNGGIAVTLNGSGVAILSAVTLSGAGLHTITAVYPGVSSAFLPSAADTTALVTAGKITPTITWTPPSAGITYGTNLSGVLTATASNGSTAIPGTFAYTATLQGGSASTITGATVLGAGAYTLTLTFTPTDTTTSATATDNVSLTVAKATPAVALTSSATTALAQSAVTFTATVSSPAGVPSGSVTFYDGTTALGTVTLGQGVATYTISSLAGGAHMITAQYTGSSDFLTLTSASLTETVNDFSLNIATGSTTSATVSAGGMASYALVIGPTSGTTFPGAVMLSVTGVPPGATATITPKTLPAGAGSTKVSLTVQLPSQSASLRGHSFLALGISPLMGILFLPFTARMRRSIGKHGGWALLLVVAVLGISLGGLTGCGGKDSGFLGNPQTNYTLTVTATSGALSHSTTLNLTVK